MDIFFNELSVFRLSSDKQSAHNKMEKFLLCFTKASKYGFKRIRTSEYINEIELTNDYTMHDWAIDKDVRKAHRDLILGSLRRPFIKDADEDKIDSYLEAEYYFEDRKYNYQKEKCYGLAAALLYESISISLESHDVWKEITLNVSKEKNDDIESKSVLNVTNARKFKSDTMCNFLFDANLYKLQTTNIAPEDKEVKFSGDHHGKQELKKLSSKLIHSPYVEKIRSTKFGGKKFIRKVNSDGSIEIVLTGTDSEYALLVQTTGKNLFETEKISEIIKSQFR